MINNPILPLEDFSGGYVSSHPSVKDYKFSPNCLNVHTSPFKSLLRRNGYIKVNSASQALVANGITNYVRSETEQYLIALWGTTLKKMDVVTSAWDGTWDTIAVSANGTALTSNFMHSTIFNGDLVITTEGRDVPQKYDPNDNSGQYTNLHYGGTGTAPSGKHIINWHDFVWIANTSTNPDRVYRSASADHTTWTATHYEDFITPRDIGVTGMAVLHGRLYVFKKFSIHRITYIGGTPLLDIKQVKSWVGTSSIRTVQNVDIPGQGEVLVYLGTDLQLYKFDGYNTTPLGTSITSYNGISKYCLTGNGSTYGLNAATLANTHAVIYPSKNWYVLFFCLDNDTTPSDAIVWDYLNNSFWPVHFNNAFTVSCIADNGSGQRRIYAAGTNYAWLLDSGNSDDEATIEAYWESMKISASAETYLKKADQMRISCSSVACTPNFSSKVNWDANYDTAETLITSQNVHIIDVPKIANLLQFKIADTSTNPAFEVYKMELMAKELGGGV